MASFTDQEGNEWRVAFHAPLIEDIREKHSIDLVNLEKDPLLKLRNDPMTLVAVTYLICQKRIEKDGLSPDDFAELLPHCDDLLAAIQEALIAFFPSGRHSHIREVLTKYSEMNAKTDQLMIEKMNQIIQDEATTQRLGSHVDREIERALDEMFPKSSNRSTSNTAGPT